MKGLLYVKNRVLTMTIPQHWQLNISTKDQNNIYHCHTLENIKLLKERWSISPKRIYMSIQFVSYTKEIIKTFVLVYRFSTTNCLFA